jgi:hypothetical protein
MSCTKLGSRVGKAKKDGNKELGHSREEEQTCKEDNTRAEKQNSN